MAMAMSMVTCEWSLERDRQLNDPCSTTVQCK